VLAPLLLLAASGVLQQPEPASETLDRGPELPRPRAQDLPRWRALVRPRADELAFESIAWIPDLAGGLRAADAQQRPLLLWAMNGHPLGCT
jgi:hypothetical protein